MTECGIAVIIPCFKCSRHILGVLGRIGKEVHRIYVVDDCCPEGTGRLVQDRISDPRVRVLFNEQNLGVGGAVMHGYRVALEDPENRILVKIDGDGQMDPALIHRFTAPIQRGLADYTKGNRFYELEHVFQMPKIRLYGNETSTLSIASCAAIFFSKHCRNTVKRIFYNYFLRDLSLASLELLAGLVLTVWGCLFGGFTWWNAVEQSISTPAGTAMLAGTMIIVGLQLLLGFFAYDMGDAPTHPLHLLYDDEAHPPADKNGEGRQ